MIIFESDETKFEGNGLGTIPEATDAQAVEELNGGDEISFKIPITAKHFHDLKLMRYILCTPSYGRNPQAYRIYKISKPINGICTVNGEHISYRLNKIPLLPFSASNASDAMAGIETHSFESPFHFHTELGTQASYNQTSPSTVRKQLGGVEGSILDVYGGQYEWDMFDVYLRKRRGTDKGITIEYGKNLTDLTQEESIEATYTGICPYWAGTVNNEPVSVYLSEKVILADNADNFPYNSIEVVDLTSKITLPEGTDKPTEDMVRKAAKAYMKSHSYGVPKVSLAVSFVDLAQTMEYEEFQNFEKVQLGDTVTVRFDSLGVNATAKVNKVTYDIINQRYIKIELGDSRTDLSSTIASQQKELNDVGSTTAGLSTTVASQQKQLDKNKDAFTKALQEEMERADENTDQMIKSLKNLTGHAFIHYTEDGQPFEFIVADNTDLSKATEVWRWNENGLAHSSTGYNGTYAGAAITADGSINADCITTGKITAVDIEGINIKGASIKGSEFSTGTGEQNEVINISKGEIKTIMDSKVTGELFAAYENGSETRKTGLALAAAEDGTLWLSYRDGKRKYGTILSASRQNMKDGHTPYIANTASGFMNFGKNHYGNGLQSHPNNYGIEIENGLIKRWSIPSGLVRETSVQGGDGDHDIAMGWNGSRLVFFVDGTFVCSLPSGYTP